MEYEIISADTLKLDKAPFQVHDYVEVFPSTFISDVSVPNNCTVVEPTWCEMPHIKLGQIICLPDTRVAILDIKSGRIPTNETFRDVEHLVDALKLKHIITPFKIQPQLA